LLLIKDDQILLSRRTNTGYEDGKYGLVAGHAESGECLSEGLAREVREEAGMIIDPRTARLTLTMHRNCVDHERADFFFDVESWSGEIVNMEPDRCDDLSWFPLDSLPENIIPYIRKAIDCYRAGEIYYEYGWAAGENYRTV
jgi:8-oxo-dGTP pyrophosphatase MutT (NUDIX family)